MGGKQDRKANENPKRKRRDGNRNSQKVSFIRACKGLCDVTSLNWYWSSPSNQTEHCAFYSIGIFKCLQQDESINFPSNLKFFISPHGYCIFPSYSHLSTFPNPNNHHLILVQVPIIVLVRKKNGTNKIWLYIYKKKHSLYHILLSINWKMMQYSIPKSKNEIILHAK